ncbi:MAG: SPOR domain-containing protein [Lachnospiraceae bacterium]|nr:SPOR domain-containing protein [Lachnospiraceae bacterium]
MHTGAFRNRAYAEDLLYRLERQNYPAFLLYSDGLYKVQVGAFAQLDNAIRMEEALRRAGYSTFITAE